MWLTLSEPFAVCAFPGLWTTMQFDDTHVNPEITSTSQTRRAVVVTLGDSMKLPRPLGLYTWRFIRKMRTALRSRLPEGPAMGNVPRGSVRRISSVCFWAAAGSVYIYIL